MILYRKWHFFNFRNFDISEKTDQKILYRFFENFDFSQNRQKCFLYREFRFFKYAFLYKQVFTCKV